MSKSEIKRILADMPKDDVIKLVLEMYSAKKEVKEYLDYYVKPDEKAKAHE